MSEESTTLGRRMVQWFLWASGALVAFVIFLVAVSFAFPAEEEPQPAAQAAATTITVPETTTTIEAPTTTTTEATTTTTAPTTTTTAPTTTTTQARSVSPADVFVEVVRAESATYRVVTWVDTATDRDLRGILDDMCDAYEVGLTIEMVALAFSNGFFEEYESISVEVDMAQENMIWFVAGAAYGACELVG